MAILKANVTGFAELAAWLQENAVPGIFSSVEWDAENTYLDAYDADGYKVLRLSGKSNSSMRAYRTDGLNPIAATYSSNALNGTHTIILCDNGFILQLIGTNTNYKSLVMVAKTNNNRIGVIFSEQTSDGTYRYTNIHHVAIGDDPTAETTTTFTPESGNQTSMTGFITNAPITGTSYCPKAFYLGAHSAYSSGFGKFLSGGKLYITNGYWCIDTEQAEEDAT